jgi:AcrR family transcriptional regulator
MKKTSKELIVEAAVSLFNSKGFNGTSIRDIAEKAKVNAANIAYYFKNKQGLLEHCFTIYFEGYVEEIEKGFELIDEGAPGCLKKIAENIMNYHYHNIALTRFVLREISIDSQFVREIMSTYLMKERYYISKVVEKGVKTREFRHLMTDYVILQLKGLLNMPFLNAQYMAEVLHVFPHEKYFAEKYLQEVFNWVDGVLCKHEYEKTVLAVY